MKLRNIPLERVNWITSIFLIVTALASLTVVPLYIWKYGVDFFQIGMFCFFFFMSGISITLGYHRLFSHRSFKAKWPVKLVTLIFGATAFENSALDWSADHRRHHKHVDEDDDPYDISKGFLWAHIGWLFFKMNVNTPRSYVVDLQKDKLVMWQHRWVQVIAVVAGLFFPAFLGYLWDGPVGALGGFLLAGILRVVAVQHSTFFINSLCHTVGRRPYSSKCSARDSALMALVTFGEGYHNYHHSFQHDYRNGVKRTSFDPTKWSIWILEKIGLVSGLRRVDPGKILLAEMAEARRQAQQRLDLVNAESVCPKTAAMLQEISEQISENYSKLEKALADRVELSRQLLDEWRKETRQHIQSLQTIQLSPA